ncbi:MAG: KpsF/GutQ family sugar-phosphate isomerase, partial [Pseudomonadota bacterium]
VIVTGMGKSGHVARKIAATFASTGTPAHFVHPGEASHGDLGMITGSDAVLALSNSGETNELSDLIDYTRRFSIPLLSISSREQSTLAATSDVALVLPNQPEACPMGLAPTTSTTMMLGLGDALAVALMSARGFSATDFSVFHPGGKLGRRLLKVDALMHSAKSLPLVRVDALMSETIVEISRRSFGCVGVITANGDLAGIITDGDLRRHMGASLLEMRADEVMTPGPKTISPSALAAEALNIMNANAITCLFVLAEGKPIGIVHIHDCLRAGIA